MTAAERCEPPEGLRERRYHWLVDPGNETRPEVTNPFRYQRGHWWMHGQWHTPDAAAQEGWRYVGPCLTPAEVAALTAERDEAMEKTVQWAATAVVLHDERAGLVARAEALAAAVDRARLHTPEAVQAECDAALAAYRAAAPDPDRQRGDRDERRRMEKEP